ncbi:hypothetical protein pb186bvf_016705 [Paramecium bursaria]
MNINSKSQQVIYTEYRQQELLSGVTILLKSLYVDKSTLNKLNMIIQSPNLNDFQNIGLSDNIYQILKLFLGKILIQQSQRLRSHILQYRIYIILIYQKNLIEMWVEPYKEEKYTYLEDKEKNPLKNGIVEKNPNNLYYYYNYK